MNKFTLLSTKQHIDINESIVHYNDGYADCVPRVSFGAHARGCV